jgi:hypothetical protein
MVFQHTTFKCIELILGCISFPFHPSYLFVLIVLYCASFCSLHALYGTDLIRNAIHGSSSLKEANREISFFFTSGRMVFGILK